MSSEFPNFVEEEGSEDGKMILSNPERYEKLDSGILFEDIHCGTEGSSINNANQQVTISYQYFGQNARRLSRGCFVDSLAKFADEFNFAADITEAVHGMKMSGYRRIIISPEINQTWEYRILDVIVDNIKQEKEMDSLTPKKVAGIFVFAITLVASTIQSLIAELSKSKDEETPTPELPLYKLIVDPLNTFPQVTRMIKLSFSKSDVDTETAPPKLPIDEQNIKGAGSGGPTIKFQVMDEGEGEVISKYQQGCFEYKEAGSREALPLEGSPIELASKLGPGFEESILEATEGMKLNERRMIFIPREVSDLEKNTFLDLKLTAIRGLNPRSRI